MGDSDPSLWLETPAIGGPGIYVHSCGDSGGGTLALSLDDRARGPVRGEEFAVGILIEPGALDVEELEAGHEACEGQGVDRELRDRLVGAGVRFVVEDVHGAVSHL